MRSRYIPTLLAVMSTLVLYTFPLSAHAFFTGIENFDSLSLGTIDDQNGWSADNSSNVVIDPVDSGNQVLAVTTDSTRLYKAVTVLNEDVRMLFFRFRFENQLNYSFGLSDSSAPDQFGDFEAELGMSSSTNELRVNDDGQDKALKALSSNTWYNVWFLIDNKMNTTQVWLNSVPGGTAAAEDKLSYLADDDQTLIDIFGFRQGGSNNLLTYFIKTGGGNSENSGPLYIDDIYLENTNALNLYNPVPEPGTLFLIIPCVLTLLRRRRA
jgi:hypothetical protein